jgi:glycosyltransferase involved in cell wall biosynthesis
VTPGSTSELRAATQRLDDDPALCRAMGTAGQARAEQFSAETVTSMYEDHYHRLLAAD